MNPHVIFALNTEINVIQTIDQIEKRKSFDYIKDGKLYLYTPMGDTVHDLNEIEEIQSFKQEVTQQQYQEERERIAKYTSFSDAKQVINRNMKMEDGLMLKIKNVKGKMDKLIYKIEVLDKDMKVVQYNVTNLQVQIIKNKKAITKNTENIASNNKDIKIIKKDIVKINKRITKVEKSVEQLRKDIPDIVKNTVNDMDLSLEKDFWDKLKDEIESFFKDPLG